MVIELQIEVSEERKKLLAAEHGKRLTRQQLKGMLEDAVEEYLEDIADTLAD